MKKLALYIVISSLSFLPVLSQDVDPGFAENVRISDAVNVVVSLPPSFVIKGFDPGVRSIVAVEQKSDVLFSIRAIDVGSWPPTKKTNLTIYCNKGLFNIHLLLDRGTEKYFYPLNPNAAILIEDHSLEISSSDKPDQASSGEISDTLIKLKSGSMQFDPDFKNYTLADDLDYFLEDRMGEGVNLEGLKCYVNNLVSTSNETYVSIKVENNSSAAFEASLIQLFISTKSPGKKETLSSGPEPLIYSAVNRFNSKVLPNQTAIYIMHFDLITLGKTNRLEVVIKEEGRRSMNFFIKKKAYYQNLKYKPSVSYKD